MLTYEYSYTMTEDNGNQYIQKHITINRDDQHFLEEHESLNLSGIVRDALKEVKKEKGWDQNS